MDVISESGAYERRELGVGDRYQTTVPARAYFAAHVADALGYALVGCDVAPGFDFVDFEICRRDALCARFPAHADIVARFTRDIS